MDEIINTILDTIQDTNMNKCFVEGQLNILEIIVNHLYDNDEVENEIFERLEQIEDNLQ